MKRVIFPNGGMPLYGDDLAFQFDEIEGCLNGIATAFGIAATKGINCCVLYGCGITSYIDRFLVSNGYILFNNVLYNCPSTTIYGTNIKAGDVILYPSVENSEWRTMEDGNTAYVYALPYIKVELLPAIPSASYIIAADLDKYRITNLFRKPYEMGGLAFQNNFSVAPGNGLEIVKQDRIVTMQGSIQGNLVAGESIVGVLASGDFAPLHDVAFCVPSSVGFLEVRIDTSGYLFASGGTVGNVIIALNFSYIV